MSTFSSRKERAHSRRVPGSGVPTAVATLIFLAFGLTLPSQASKVEIRTEDGEVRIITTNGDSLPRVNEVRITRDGISIDPQSGSLEGRIVHFDDSDPGIRIDISDGDPTIRYSSRGGHGEIVSFFRDIEIPKGRVVNGEIVALFGNVRIEGEANSDVVAIFGSIELGDSARVGGDVVALGGINASPSSQIQGDSVSIPIMGFPGLSPWAMWTGLFMTILLAALFGALVAALFPERVRRVAEVGAQRTMLSLLLGAASFPLLTVAFCLLMLTVIGIPVAILIVMLYPAALYIGFVSGSALLGSRLRGTTLADIPVWLAAVIGIVFIGVFYLVGGLMLNVGGDIGGVIRAIGLGIMAVGFLLAALTSLIGVGALFLSKLGDPGGTAVADPQAPQAPAPDGGLSAPTTQST